MSRCLLLLLALVVVLGPGPAHGQSPKGINYQAVARDNGGSPLPNQQIRVRFTVLEGGVLGTPRYVETHSLTTTSLGLFNVVIGSGAVEQGSFAAIDWGKDDHFLKLELDPAGGTNYLSMGTTQLLSVPYAFVADTVLNEAPGDDWGGQAVESDTTLLGTGTTANPLGISPMGAAPGQTLKWDGTQWAPGNDQLSFSDTLQVAARLAGNGTPASPLDLAAQGANLNEVLKFNGTSWVPAPDENTSVSVSAPLSMAGNQIGLSIGAGLALNSGQLQTVAPGGDVTGALNALAVTGLQGRPVAASNPAGGDVLAWNGSAWAPAAASADNDWTLSGGNIYRTNGNVGIGTTNPLARLEIGHNATNAFPQLALFETQDDFSRIAFVNNQTTEQWLIAGVPANDGSGRLNFFNSGFGGDVMSLTNTGQVGIGTTLPLATTKLDVFSGRRFAGFFETDSTAGVATGVLGVYGGGGQLNGAGVVGESLPADGWGLGGEFIGGSIGASGIGSGGNPSGANTIIGVLGEATATTPVGTGSAAGVYGEADGSVDFNYSVYGIAGTQGSNNYAGFFEGDVHVNGFLSKSAGTFRIDHPLNPANQYLNHSFVESNEMLNIYSGNVRTDASGRAVVELPDYVMAVNRNFRYQLTVIGAPARAWVAKEVAKDQFVIRTDEPKVKVSWELKGERDDPYAREHPLVVEEDKAPAHRGKYLQPGLYDQPASRAIHRTKPATRPARQPRTRERAAEEPGRTATGQRAPEPATHQPPKDEQPAR